MNTIRTDADVYREAKQLTLDEQIELLAMPLQGAARDAFARFRRLATVLA